MTFINRRIIKRPTLFATSRRNFGNLLTHYETGQDGTTPDPDPTPDPVAFTTSWSTNGGIVEANLTGISSHRTTEVIVLTRDDGTVLATLDENKVGDWDLQHDEGTTYASYTYNVRLDGVIKSTFSRDYQPNVPTFTTNFFSNTAKRISCGIENIVNPHDSYSVRLARPDDTILDTQVLNDATPFFLQFTELDYGTYDYKLLLSKWTTTSTSNPNIPPESYWVDTVIATHTQLFPRPEPTFTTSWSKSGLTVSADLSSIVGAHPEFYAYLCRDDGTTLATHHFQTGQTTASLSFTETEYGTFTYQLKLGTTVVSSHTETYVRPTPTYTASFSTNELTFTASITSITNAHNSFAITLERDDGTVLQTHTLADGETSFTFTQTETSYATFNYVVKLNGTQTDTYSATYTPPPTPTFDIALTNDDLAIAATLTNIVNPDPYYTVMIHDADDTHLVGHTFATGDTTVVLTWTETSYGEKTYTKLLNGASIGTETITLTDPNTPYTRLGLTLETHPDSSFNGGTWAGSHNYAEVTTANEATVPTVPTGIFSLWYNSIYAGEGGFSGDAHTFKYENGIWSDVGSLAPHSLTNTETYVSQTSVPDGQYIYLWASSTLCRGRIVSPYYEAPAVTQPTLVNTITFTSGSWSGVSYEYRITSGTKLVYTWYRNDTGYLDNRAIVYDYSNNMWADAVDIIGYGGNIPDSVLINNETISLRRSSDELLLGEFTDPYYEAPVLNWWENGYGALPVITGTGALNGQSFSFYAEDSTHIQFILSGTESNPSTIQFTKADGSWVDGTSGDWPSQVNYDSTYVILRTNTWSNEFVNPNTSSPYTPPSYFLSSPRAIGDWINCADNPFTWNGTTYTLQRTGGSMKYTSDDGTSAIWTYCNSTGGNSQSGDSVKRLSSGGWEDGPGSRPNGNNSINEHNNVLFISHPNTPVEAVWGFDDPYDVSP